MDYDEDRDEEARREAIDERKRNQRGCKCGYPDWPGPAACPVHGENGEIKDD